MRIIFFTDLHLGDNHGWREGWQLALHEIRTLAPDVLICGGDAGIDDAVGDTERWLKTLQAEVGMPVYFCAGNHEIDTGYYHANRQPGSLYQSWDAGGAHFIILDCIHTTPPAAHLPHKWYGAIDDAQLDWLRRDLAQVSFGTPLILTTHMPLQSTFPLRHDTPQNSTFPYNVVREGDRILPLLQPYKNAVCLSGHLHENERSYNGNVQLLNTGAIAGNWWRQGGNSPNFDGAPQGFRVLDISRDGSIITFYRALDPRQCCEAVRFQAKDGTWFLNVFDGSARTRVFLQERELSFADPAAAPGEKRPAHLWVLPRHLKESRDEVIIHFEDGRIARATV